MLDSEVFLPVVGQRLVELPVLLGGDVVGSPGPDGLGLVEFLILGVFLFDGFLLLLVLVLLVLVSILADVLNLWLIFLLLLITLLLLLLSLVVADLLLPLLLDHQPDGVADELRVLLDDLLDLLLLEVLGLVLLHLEDNLGAAAQGLPAVGLDGEGPTSRGLPDVLLVVVVLGGDGDLVSNQVGGVETHAELTNHGYVSPGRESLHEGLGPGLGDGPEVVDHVSLGHANTGVNDGEGIGIRVRDDLDEEFLLVVQLAGISEGLVPDLVQGIGGVGDQFSEENFFVGVEGVDDQAHQLGISAWKAKVS